MMNGNLTRLRAVAFDDMEELFQWRNDEEVSLFAVGNSPLLTHVSREQVENTYETIISMNRAENGVFSILDLEGRIIGIADYRDVNSITRSAVMGITIGDKAYWGKGYGSDAIRAMVRYLFLQLNLERIQLDTWSGNVRAIRSYEKCGFEVEGRLRQNEYVEGTYYDTVVMGLLRSEWEDTIDR
ncbi:GNAT family N-acetyltransferase [Guptibacillus algicola]|uniref:GNAT family N-acetyltransferase n=1 Tax=Guptibacillus algicola TaxID=225844 RepID=UPI001CD44F71|nr:GNAT family protein [Alkalihalobacillus algicola]MCA0986905.1 GNAT family N-acetyltransferase [Alkalihalobacillus algicola]